MINLLPDEIKRDIRAARTNVVLVRYNLFTVVAAALLVLFCAFFYVMLGISQTNSVTKSTDNTQKAETYASVRKQADEYRTNLTIAGKVLDNSVNYTSVIFAITNLLPKGVVLGGVTLNAADFGQQTTFSAKAKTYQDATKLKESFQNSTIFENVYLQNLTDSASEGEEGPYPISITISAKLKKAGQQ